MKRNRVKRTVGHMWTIPSHFRFLRSLEFVLAQSAFIFMVIFTCCLVVYYCFFFASCVCPPYVFLWGVMRLWDLWFTSVVCELTIVNYIMYWIKVRETERNIIDSKCCNRLIACHIFFIQQWTQAGKYNACFIQFQSTTCAVDFILVFFSFNFSLSFFSLSLCSIVWSVCGQRGINNAEWTSHFKMRTKICTRAQLYAINEIIHQFSCPAISYSLCA